MPAVTGRKKKCAIPPMLKSLGFDKAAVRALIEILTPERESKTKDSVLGQIKPASAVQGHPSRS
jgi:hypothetical protein